MLIIEYNPEWVNYFDKIKDKLDQFLINIEVNIEHVGSTSVPKLTAKPIIDMDIISNENFVHWFF